MTNEDEGENNFVKLSCSEMAETKCVMCQTNLHDPLMYGESFKIDNLVCHYFCLLLSSSLEQRGQDDEGLLGFFPKDIRAEVRRGSRLRCSYCRKTGATIGCHLKSCKKAFHLPCGLNSGSMHQFFDSFKSYCSNHRLSQSVDQKILKAAAEEEDGLVCPICYDAVSNEVSVDTLWAPCCKKRWFHRTCVARQAQAQGYFFKCPMCNNNDIFNKEMKKFGIYIPERDAAWEREPNAFNELLHRYSKCDSETCKCPDGRTYSQNTGSWRMLRCNSCGSQGTHVVCSGLKISALNNSFRCPLCVEVLCREEKRTESADGNSASNLENASHPSCSASTSSSSSRRSADSPTEQASKRRKPSPDVPLVCSLNITPGPSRPPSNDDEDEIIYVDDSESDIEVVDDKKPDIRTLDVNMSETSKPAPTALLAKTYPVPQYVHKDLFTKEGKKIKVVKVTAGDTVPVEEGSLGAVQIQCPEIKHDIVPTTATDVNATTAGLLPNCQDVSISLVPATTKTNIELSNESPSPSNLGIKINNVRHSEELFSPIRSEEQTIRPQFPFLQGGNLNLQSQLPPLLQQQHQNIIYVPVTANGKMAVQAFMVPPGFANQIQALPPPQQYQLPPHIMMQLQQQLNAQQTAQRQSSKNVDIVTID